MQSQELPWSTTKYNPKPSNNNNNKTLGLGSNAADQVPSLALSGSPNSQWFPNINKTTKKDEVISAMFPQLSFLLEFCGSLPAQEGLLFQGQGWIS